MQRRLGVNLDAVAVLRQTRRMRYPDPVAMAAIAEAAGADLITVHLREDRRYVQERDVRLLRQTIQTSLNLRLCGTQEMLKVAYDIKPDAVTLVPEARDDMVTVGLDVNHHRDHVRKYVQALRDADIDVRVFIDADIDQVRAAHRADVSAVVLDTGKYADARGNAEIDSTRQRIADAARAANKLGMRVAVANSLNFHNVAGLTGIVEINEIQVGHCLIAQSLTTGLERAVRDMARLIRLPAS